MMRGISRQAGRGLAASLLLTAPFVLVDCAGGADERKFGSTGDGDASTGGRDGAGGSNGGRASGSGGRTGGGAPNTGGGAVVSCTGDSECDDDNPCNGVESCDEGACVRGATAADGEPCTGTPTEGGTGSFVCHAGNCVESRCGDEVVDPATNEACDDGNEVDADGCDNDCTYSCSEAADCNDGNVCNGAESCDTTTHACVAGTNASPGTSCGTDLVCRGADCVPVGCGDGTTAAGEECDDGNTNNGDGCNNDCTFTCETDDECNDQSVCTGTEICDGVAHVCRSGTGLRCNDDDPCTQDTCDPERGCVYPLIDPDGDGHASETLGECGDDCDDEDATVFLGAEELCDNKDNNCNGTRDEAAPRWYVDCDGDGYAPADATPIQQCAEPPRPTSCPSGSAAKWTTRVPADKGTRDCWDASALAYPGASGWQTQSLAGRNSVVDYDYSCDDTEEMLYTATGVTNADSCTSGIIIDPGPVPGPIVPNAPIPPFRFCSGRSGWSAATPAACGTTAAFNDCYYDDCAGKLNCTAGCKRRIVYNITQSCR